jgi:hypothetical protein
VLRLQVPAGKSNAKVTHMIRKELSGRRMLNGSSEVSEKDALSQSSGAVGQVPALSTSAASVLSSPVHQVVAVHMRVGARQSSHRTHCGCPAHHPHVTQPYHQRRQPCGCCCPHLCTRLWLCI